MSKIGRARCIIVEEELERSLNEASIIEMSDSAKQSQLHIARLLKKKLDIFRGENFTMIKEADIEKVMEDDIPEKKVNVFFRFLIHPVDSTVDKAGKISTVVCGHNQLDGPAYKQKAIPDTTRRHSILKADLAVTSIGYYSEPIEGIGQFDEKSHVLPNVNGCVLAGTGSDQFRVGIYCAGWVKTGAKGIIDTTMRSAEETYNNLKNHLIAEKLQPKEDPLFELHELRTKLGRRTTTFDDWLKIDAYERRLGEERGKVRHKLASNDEIIEYLNRF